MPGALYQLDEPSGKSLIKVIRADHMVKGDEIIFEIAAKDRPVGRIILAFFAYLVNDGRFFDETFEVDRDFLFPHGAEVVVCDDETWKNERFFRVQDRNSGANLSQEVVPFADGCNDVVCDQDAVRICFSLS